MLQFTSVSLATAAGVGAISFVNMYRQIGVSLLRLCTSKEASMLEIMHMCGLFAYKQISASKSCRAPPINSAKAGAGNAAESFLNTAAPDKFSNGHAGSAMLQASPVYPATRPYMSPGATRLGLSVRRCIIAWGGVTEQRVDSRIDRSGIRARLTVARSPPRGCTRTVREWWCAPLLSGAFLQPHLKLC